MTNPTLTSATRARPCVVNTYQRHLHNILEAYFYTRQDEVHRCVVLSEVGLSRIVELQCTHMDGFNVSAMSVDALLVDSTSARPLAVFEADGDEHRKIGSAQRRRDMTKDAILRHCNIPIYRLEPEGEHPDPEAVMFALEQGLTTIPSPSDPMWLPADENGIEHRCMPWPNQKRLVDEYDIEWVLQSASFVFPVGWKRWRRR